VDQTKSGYSDFDTFISAEAVIFTRLYLEEHLALHFIQLLSEELLSSDVLFQNASFHSSVNAPLLSHERLVFSITLFDDNAGSERLARSGSVWR